MNEIADAYDKLGYVHNWSFRETEKALADFQKSLALREKSLAAAPDQTEVGKKINVTPGCIFEVYAILGNTPKILEISEKARLNNLEILRLDPGNPQTLRSLSGEADRYAGFLKKAGREAESAEKIRESFEFIERAVEITRNNLDSPEDQSQLASYWMQKGGLLEKTGRDEEALEIYRQAAEKNQGARNPQICSAKTAYEKSLEILREIPAISPPNGDSRETERERVEKIENCA